MTSHGRGGGGGGVLTCRMMMSMVTRNKVMYMQLMTCGCFTRPRYAKTSLYDALLPEGQKIPVLVCCQQGAPQLKGQTYDLGLWH